MSLWSRLRARLVGVSPTEAIAQLFEQHGVAVERSGERVLLPEHGCWFQTRVFPRDSGSCQLDFAMRLPGGRTLVESFGGFGKKSDAMARDAVENFTRSSFHIIYRGLLVPGSDDQVEVQTWTIGGVDYHVTLGPVVHRGHPPEGAHPASWGPHFEAAIAQQSLPDDLCWLRFYYAHAQGETRGLEVLLNNEPWEPIERVMGALDWPKVSSFYGIRAFFVLRAVTSRERPS